MGTDDEPAVELPDGARSQLETVRALLRGESVAVINPKGEYMDLSAERLAKDEGSSEGG